MRIVATTFALLLLAFTACTESDFAGRALDTNRDGAADGEDGGAADGEDGGDGGLEGEDGLDTESGDGGEDGKLGDSSEGGDDQRSDDEEGLDTDDEEIAFNPQQCTGANGFVAHSGTVCPEHSAVFISDDGTTSRVACCPLPSRDILDRDSEPVHRGSSCGPDEVAVGALNSGFICHKINTKKYRLGVPQTLCYYGHGASGGQGAASCKNIIAQFQQLIALFGDKDGCVAQPYGAIVTHKTSKRCKDQKGTQILDLNGNPIQMFP